MQGSLYCKGLLIEYVNSFPLVIDKLLITNVELPLVFQRSRRDLPLNPCVQVEAKYVIYVRIIIGKSS